MKRKTIGVVEQAKELLAEDRHRIRLHDFLVGKIRDVLPLLTQDRFPVHGQWTNDEFIERLTSYEKVTADLCSMQALLGYWGTEAHTGTLALAPKRLCGDLKLTGGNSGWPALRWYPALLLLYSGGIAAVAAERYDNLRVLMNTMVSDPERSRGETTLIRATVEGLRNIHDAFKILPDHKGAYTPQSNYIFTVLKPILDDLFFLASDYEGHFDRFEVLLALEHAEQYARHKDGRIWGPVGRFGWKFHQGESSPLHRVIVEAETQGDAWPPIKAGLFQGSVERFKEIASEYSQFIARLNWW